MSVNMENAETGVQQRAYWVTVLERIARPVLTALADGRLRVTMPIESKHGTADRADRYDCTHLEAVGRLLVGIAPWLELGPDPSPEGALRAELADLARRSIDSATDPFSPDRLNFGSPLPGTTAPGPAQALVDSAFLAQSLLRAPTALWGALGDSAKANVLAALAESRQITPGTNNWLLFSAAIEAAMAAGGAWWDGMRVDYAIRKLADWYVGDGTYGDGPNYHWDYYNSFVIQPMILDVLRSIDPEQTGRFGLKYSVALARAQRYAAVQERLISPEGTIPPIGRSLAYRIGALQTLAHVSLLDALPSELPPSQVRCAMTAVMHRLMDAPGTFDDDGWLRIGFCGAQPGLGEGYISTGSLYLCSTGLLPLGLPPSHDFWTGPSLPWTSQQIYQGDDAAADHAI